MHVCCSKPASADRSLEIVFQNCEGGSITPLQLIRNVHLIWVSVVGRQ